MTPEQACASPFRYPLESPVRDKGREALESSYGGRQPDEPHDPLALVPVGGRCLHEGRAVRLVDCDARARAPVLPEHPIFVPSSCPLFALLGRSGHARPPPQRWTG